MRTAAFLIFLLCLGACFLLYRAGSVERDGTPAVSTATPEVPPPGVIARILGRDIRREDLDPPPGATTTDLRQFRKDKLAALIWKAFEDKYETEHPLQATDEEVAQLNDVLSSIPEGRKSDVEKQIESERAQLTEDEQAEVAKFAADLRREMVKSWKFNRALYRQYGVAVIFQQFDPVEPVGAYRSWLKEQETAGDFTIFDEQSRAEFWE